MDTVTIPRTGGDALCGAGEACDILGLPTSKLPPLRRRDAQFPAPVQELKCGPVWLRADVERFAEARAAR